MASSVSTLDAPARTSSRDLDRFRRALKEGGSMESAFSLLLGLPRLETPGIRRVVEEGLPFSALERFQRNIDLPFRELADAIRVPLRTLDRRKRAGRLEPDESDRAVRLSRVFGAALTLFEGDEEAARAWLKRRQVALGNERPIDFVRTEVGAREVERLIGRLEHGVFS